MSVVSCDACWHSLSDTEILSDRKAHFWNDHDFQNGLCICVCVCVCVWGGGWGGGPSDSIPIQIMSKKKAKSNFGVQTKSLPTLRMWFSTLRTLGRLNLSLLLSFSVLSDCPRGLFPLWWVWILKIRKAPSLVHTLYRSVVKRYHLEWDLPLETSLSLGKIHRQSSTLDLRAAHLWFSRDCLNWRHMLSASLSSWHGSLSLKIITWDLQDRWENNIGVEGKRQGKRR